MEKPVILRQKTWDFLKSKLSERVSAEEIAQHPAKYSYQAGIIDHPELLQNTVVTLEGDVEYKITYKAAEAIKNGDELIILRRLDGQDTSISRARIIKFLENGCEFDQMEKGA